MRGQHLPRRPPGGVLEHGSNRPERCSLMHVRRARIHSLKRVSRCRSPSHARDRIRTGWRQSGRAALRAVPGCDSRGSNPLAQTRLSLPFETVMRGTGFEPEADGCARSLRSLRALRLPGFKSVLLFAHFVRSCAGPDSNRRTPTGQRPKRASACGPRNAPIPVITTAFSSVYRHKWPPRL